MYSVRESYGVFRSERVAAVFGLGVLPLYYDSGCYGGIRSGGVTAVLGQRVLRRY